MLPGWSNYARSATPRVARAPAPGLRGGFALLALMLLISCSSRSGASVIYVTATPQSIAVQTFKSQGAVGASANQPTATRVIVPTETATSPVASPTAASTPLPTLPREPTLTPEPTQTFTAAPTPTRTQTPTITPTPTATSCGGTYCVVKATCIPNANTRAIGTVYENGVPKNDVRVRVSYADGGPPVVKDFISGHDPLNPQQLDPAHPGYYQIGIHEGSPYDGNWWVFLVDNKGNKLSVGRYFKTTDVMTGSSCQVAITDFNAITSH